MELVGIYVMLFGPVLAAFVVGGLLAISGSGTRSWLFGLGLIGLGVAQLLCVWIWYRSSCWETWQPCQDSGLDTLFLVTWCAAVAGSLGGAVYGVGKWVWPRSGVSADGS